MKPNCPATQPAHNPRLWRLVMTNVPKTIWAIAKRQAEIVAQIATFTSFGNSWRSRRRSATNTKKTKYNTTYTAKVSRPLV